MASTNRVNFRLAGRNGQSTALDSKAQLFRALFDKTSSASAIESLASIVRDINEPNILGHRPMHAAVTWHGPDVIRVIYNAGGRLDLTDGLGRTPLEKAERMRNHENIRALRRLESEQQPALKSA